MRTFIFSTLAVALFLFVIPSTRAAASCVPGGALLHLPLLEGGGTRAEDSADPLVHGTLLGGTGWAFGPPAFRQGYALSFDGSDDRVVVEHALVSPGESFSFSAWIQADARFTGGSIASQLSISTHRPQGWHVYLYPDGSIAPVLYGDAGALDQAVPTRALDGEWHHIAVVFLHDGPRASSALFVDGVFAGATRNVIVGNTQAQAPIVLGALPGGTGFRGLLADIAVYARALHAQEIARQHGLCSQTRALLSIPTQSQIVHPKRPALPSPNVVARSSSRLGGGRHGHRSDMVLASVQFVLAQHSGTTVQQTNDPRLCALRRTLGVRPEPDVAALVAKRISTQLHTSQEGVLAALRDPTQCTPQRAVDVPAPPIPFPVDKEGLPVSTSDTWNRCIRFGYVTLPMIRQNADLTPANARGTRMRPKTCGDYALGDDRWRHPDFPALEYFEFRRRPHTLLLPQGYRPWMLDDN